MSTGERAGPRTPAAGAADTEPRRSSERFSWSIETGSIVCRDETGVIFGDTGDHWEQGVLRLLRLSEDEGRAWVECVAELSLEQLGRPFHALEPELRIEALRRGSTRFFGTGDAEDDDRTLARCSPVLGYEPDVVWADFSHAPHFAIVGSTEGGLGWLVDKSTGRLPTEAPVQYERSYFQGAEAAVGYGDYLGQRGWREEKAARQVRELSGVARYLGIDLGPSARILDVGAGFGYFRKAAGDIGWRHEGVEPSEFANSITADVFGFSSYSGDLSEYAATGPDEFDAATMWDVIEHVDDPPALLRCAAGLLRERGLLCIRTPNLNSVERVVFGARYHSFKLEHLFYFSSGLLVRLLEDSGFEVVFLTSESHLLRGFMGHRTRGFASTLRGSDLFAVAQLCRQTQ